MVILVDQWTVTGHKGDRQHMAVEHSVLRSDSLRHDGACPGAISRKGSVVGLLGGTLGHGGLTDNQTSELSAC